MADRHARQALVLALTLLALLAATVPGAPPALAKDGRNAAVITGLAIGAAALAAASRSHQSEYYQPYYGQAYAQPEPQPGYAPPPDYGYQYQAVFHPYAGVTCYPAQRSCYKANGNFSPTITSRIFGY